MDTDLIIQKYGGATLSDPQKISQAANRIAELAHSGKKMLIVVSAMGKTTNSLIELANQVSENPQKRELDMLLSAGERISMALVSMALNKLGCSAISFTGSQAGILTNESHLNAFITDIKPMRVQDALKNNKIVILAGFQGVSPNTKDVTTLGRGGSDTTAVAMSAALGAKHCEILKDVPAIFTADPNLVHNAKEINELTYEELMDMTFWGAKVLHYRSVELASKQNVSLYIGPAANNKATGSWVTKHTTKDKNMFETQKILSLNSHENVLDILIKDKSIEKAWPMLTKFFTAEQIADPQLLELYETQHGTHAIITGPNEVVAAIKKHISSHYEFQLKHEDLCTITATCTGATSHEIPSVILQKLSEKNIEVIKLTLSAMSCHVYVHAHDRAKAITELHALV